MNPCPLPPWHEQVQNSNNPRWPRSGHGDSTSLFVYHQRTSVRIEVWDYDHVGDDDFLGEADHMTVKDLVQLIGEGGQGGLGEKEETFQLYDKKKGKAGRKTCGQLTLGLQYLEIIPQITGNCLPAASPACPPARLTKVYLFLPIL